MVKNTLDKIRPYRVFKQNGRYFVRINNKRVFIAHKHAKKGKKQIGDKQIVSVVVNNLMAQRKATRRRKRKDVVPALLKPPSSDQPANGKSVIPNGKIDLSNVGPSDPPPKEQAPTTDPLYVSRKQPLSIEDLKPPDADTYSLLEDMGTSPDEVRTVMNAYKYWQDNQRLKEQLLGMNSTVDISVLGPDQPGPAVPDPTELNVDGHPVNDQPEQVGDQAPIAEPVPVAGVEEEKQMEPPPNAVPAPPRAQPKKVPLGDAYG